MLIFTFQNNARDLYSKFTCAREKIMTLAKCALPVVFTPISPLLKKKIFELCRIFRNISDFCFCSEFHFFFKLWWVPHNEEAFSGLVLNSLRTCWVVNYWTEAWWSPHGSWSTRRRATITPRHASSTHWLSISIRLWLPGTHYEKSWESSLINFFRQKSTNLIPKEIWSSRSMFFFFTKLFWTTVNFFLFFHML